MAGKTLHIATAGHHVPVENSGSNPLAIGSEYHLGPSSGVFGIAFSPDLGFAQFTDMFNPDLNPAVVQATNADLTIAHGTKPTAMGPLNVIIAIAGVCYRLPSTLSRKIRGRGSARVYWQTTTGEAGSFRFRRRAPVVF